jgi:hypothetical protein
LVCARSNRSCRPVRTTRLQRSAAVAGAAQAAVGCAAVCNLAEVKGGLGVQQGSEEGGSQCAHTHWLAAAAPAVGPASSLPAVGHHHSQQSCYIKWFMVSEAILGVFFSHSGLGYTVLHFWCMRSGVQPSPCTCTFSVFNTVSFCICYIELYVIQGIIRLMVKLDLLNCVQHVSY